MRSRKLLDVIPADTQHLRETLVSRQTVFDGGLLQLSVDEVRFPSGRTGRREVVEHPGAVAVVATNEQGDVVLVRQWRHPAGRALWELPAGTREPGEDPRLCAERELSEETGFTASEWTALGCSLVAPGYSTEEMFFFRATGLTGGDIHPDEDETLDVAIFDAAGIQRLIEEGEVDIKTIAGLALAGMSLSA